MRWGKCIPFTKKLIKLLNRRGHLPTEKIYGTEYSLQYPNVNLYLVPLETVPKFFWYLIKESPWAQTNHNNVPFKVVFLMSVTLNPFCTTSYFSPKYYILSCTISSKNKHKT